MYRTVGAIKEYRALTLPKQWLDLPIFIHQWNPIGRSIATFVQDVQYNNNSMSVNK